MTPEGGLLDPAALRRRLLAAVRPLPPRPVPLVEAAGLVLAEDLVAPFDLPRFPNAAMDGFAVRSEDAAPGARLRVAGEAPAGHPSGAPVGPGEAVTIATGGAVPEGADAVVPVEEVEREGAEVVLRAAVRRGANVRAAGEDLREGQVVVPAGTVLGPGQVAAAAALGRAEVVVHPRPRAAVLPTGDEVRAGGEPLGPGQVYDCVSAPLAVLLREVGAEPRLRGAIPDRAEDLASAVREAAAAADLVLTIGGVSAGEWDLVGRLGPGEVRSVRLALRPAKPFAYGEAFSVPLYGLPGNPASALAAFEELVRPVLLAMMGKPPAPRPSARAVLAEPLEQRPGRHHLVRARVWREGGRLRARPAGRQGAGMIHSLAAANAWAVVPAEVAALPAGAEVEVRLLAEPLEGPE